MSKPEAAGPIWDGERDGGGAADPAWDGDADAACPTWDGYSEEMPRWPLSWRQLEPSEWWPWFEQLWEAVCTLRERYRLMVRSGWWEDEIQVEALAALAAWAAATTPANGTIRPARLPSSMT